MIFSVDSNSFSIQTWALRICIYAVTKKFMCIWYEQDEKFLIHASLDFELLNCDSPNINYTKQTSNQ